MISERERIYAVTFFTLLIIVIGAVFAKNMTYGKDKDEVVNIGFVYVGDRSDSYTNSFIRTQQDIENQFGKKVKIIPKYNVPENNVEAVLDELVKEKCELIFTTSGTYWKKTKAYAEKHTDIEFCQVAGGDANEEPILANYHTFMGHIYQGRYISGVVAGMKLKELIDSGAITPGQAKIGYIGSYPIAEVVSGYTSFFLGVRSVVPEAVMTVRYTYTWGNYKLEYEYAKKFIDDGCVIISQHSDTAGPAAACEETDRSQIVYYVSYNENLRDVAPTTYLIGCRQNWSPYITEAVQAVIRGRDIESSVKGRVNGNDIGAGFDKDWVQMLDLNERSAADGTEERVEKLIEQFKNGKITVFKGDYTGVNPDDPNDTIDLKNGYIENEKCSSPTFNYILKDYITIE